MSGGYDDSIPQLLKKSDTVLRGHNKKLSIKGSNKDVRKYHFTLRVRKVWNSLPYDIVNAKDVKSFEIGLDKHWSKQPLMYDDHKAEIIT